MFWTKKEKALKVTVVDTPAEEMWRLEGRLAWPWVYQLRENWRKEHATVPGRACIVDLNRIIFVDRIGQRMLLIMATQGAQFVASGAEMKRVLDRLGSTIHNVLQSDPSAYSRSERVVNPTYATNANAATAARDE
jgi:hypothetical protein